MVVALVSGLMCLPLQVLGLPHSAFRSFCLGDDPVPRAMLSVDPSFSMVKQWRGVRELLQLRQWFLGEGVKAPFTPDTFLYDNLGEVHLIKWSLDGGHQVTSALCLTVSTAVLV